jgi:beta-glucuronidase
MHRTFLTSQSRAQVDLSGTWDFVTDPKDRGLEEEWHDTFPVRAERVWVPGVWNTHRPYLNYEGVAWYRCRFMLPVCRGAKICFAAVAHQANVWLDGEPLGDHYGGFTPFAFVVRSPRPGSHELVVRVDNTHDNRSTVPSDRLDWFRYGAISARMFTAAWAPVSTGVTRSESTNASFCSNSTHTGREIPP